MHNDICMVCRVCGYKSESPPWGEDNSSPNFDFCPCCGVEHGYQDATPAGTRKYRENWINSGAVWDDSKMKPKDWSLDVQMLTVPAEFL